jgi:PAS domain S-box-containing protein
VTTKPNIDETDDPTDELARLRLRVAELERAQKSWERTKESQLWDIVENLPYGFAWFDADRRLVFCNRIFKEIYAVVADDLVPGAEFETLHRKLLDLGWFPEAVGREEEWLKERVEKHCNPTGPYEFQLSDGRWQLFDERLTADGGIAGLRIDITKEKQAVAALQESEARFRDVAEVSSDWVWEMGPDLRFTYISDRVYELNGLPRGAFDGKTRSEVVGNPEMTPAWRAHLDDLENHRPFRNYEYSRTTADGQIHHFRVSGKPVFGEDGVFRGYRGAGTDITEMVAAQVALKNSEELFRSLVDNSPGAIALKRLDGRIEFINKSMQQWYGFTEADAIGKTSRELFPGAQGDSYANHDKDVIDQRVAVEREHLAIFADGSEHILSTTRFPIFNVDGDMTGVGATNMDITARKQAEREVAEQSALLQTVFDAAPVSFSLRDTNRRFVFVNKRVATEMGGHPNDFIGKTSEEVHGAAPSGVTVDALVKRVLDIKQPLFGHEIEPARRPGQFFRYSVVPVLDDNGDVQGVLAIGQDISAQKKSEDAVFQSEALLRSVIENSPSTITVQDLEGRVLLANDAFVSTFGITQEQAIGQLDSTFMAPAQFKRKVAHEAAVLKSNSSVTQEWDRNLPSGKIGRRLVTKFPIRNTDGEIISFGTIGVDLSELQRMQEDLHALEARYRNILQIAPEAIITTDAYGSILVFNDAAEATFGYERSEMIGRPLDVLLPDSVRGVHGHHLKAFIEGDETSRLMGGRGDISGRRSDGSIFPAEASISKLQSGGETILTVTMHDITERKEAEGRLRIALSDAQKADRAKQDFLANMSHELRTPLNAIIGFADVIGLEMFGALENDRYREYIQDITVSAHHLLTLVNDMLDIAKIEAGKLELDLEDVDLSDVAAEAVRELSVQMGNKNLNFEGVVEKYDETIYADTRAVRQILVNLLSNAMKFTPRRRAHRRLHRTF